MTSRAGQIFHGSNIGASKSNPSAEDTCLLPAFLSRFDDAQWRLQYPGFSCV